MAQARNASQKAQGETQSAQTLNGGLLNQLEQLKQQLADTDRRRPRSDVPAKVFRRAWMPLPGTWNGSANQVGQSPIR